MANLFTFDGPNLRFISHDHDVVNGKLAWTVWDVYREWKEWVLEGEGAKYPPAFRVVGGDPTGPGEAVGTYLFVQNGVGWRYVPPDVPLCEITVKGSLYLEDSGTPWISYVPGNTVSIEIEKSSLTNQVTFSTGSGLSQEQATQLAELWRLAGLDLAAPLSVTQSARIAGAISQAIAEANGTVTVTRQ